MKALGHQGRERAAELDDRPVRRRIWPSKSRRLIGWDEILEGGLPAVGLGDVVARREGRGRCREPGPRRRAVARADAVPRQSAERPQRRTAGPPRRSSTLADGLQLRADAGGDRAGQGAARARRAGQCCGASISSRPYQMQHAIFPRAAALAEIDLVGQGRRAISPASSRGSQPQIAALARVGDRGRGQRVRGRLHARRARAAMRCARGKVTVALATQAPLRHDPLHARRQGADRAIARLCRAAVGEARRRRSAPRRSMRDGHADREPRLFETEPRGAAAPAPRPSWSPVPRASLGLRVPLTSEATGQCAGVQRQHLRHLHRLSGRAARCRARASRSMSPGCRAITGSRTTSPGVAPALQRDDARRTAGAGRLHRARARKPVDRGDLPAARSATRRHRFSVHGDVADDDGRPRHLPPIHRRRTSDPFYAVERMQLTETTLMRRWLVAARR